MKEILNLSVNERIFMVEAIWDSIVSDPKSGDIELSEVTRKELDKRMESHLQNPNAGSTWDEVKTRILKNK